MALSEEEKKVKEYEKKLCEEAVRLSCGDIRRVTASIRKVIPSSVSKERKAYLWRILRPKVEAKVRADQKKNSFDLKSNRGSSTQENHLVHFPVTSSVARDAKAREFFHQRTLQEDW